MELLTEIENSFPVLEELFDENDSKELIDCGKLHPAGKN